MLLFFDNHDTWMIPSYECYKNLILDRYDTDVYIHTWFDDEGGKYDVSSWAELHGGKNCVILLMY